MDLLWLLTQASVVPLCAPREKSHNTEITEMLRVLRVKAREARRTQRVSFWLRLAPLQYTTHDKELVSEQVVMHFGFRYNPTPSWSVTGTPCNVRRATFESAEDSLLPSGGTPQ